MYFSSSDLTGGGVFTISLDFELFWGMADIRDLSGEYEEQLLRTRNDVIPRLLSLFEEYGVHATWATVGLLMFESRDAIDRGRPSLSPSYSDAALSSYEYLGPAGSDEASDPCRLAPSVVREIQRVPYQEVGSHSFSHFYVLEQGVTTQDFADDIAAWSRAAAPFDLSRRTICFARNQYDAHALAQCVDSGIAAYRGNEPALFYRAVSKDHDTVPRKIARRIDTYLPLTKHNCPTIPEMASSSKASKAPINVSSTRFLRAFDSRLRVLEPLKRKRIISGINHAAKTNALYHLWWHPQDFAVDTEENFETLEEILDFFANRREQQGMRSMNMSEVAAESLAHMNAASRSLEETVI